MSPNTKDSAEEPTVHRRPTELTVIAVWTCGFGVNIYRERNGSDQGQSCHDYGKSYDHHKDPRP